LIVVETSGRTEYARTRRFYARTMGYETVARISDFYRSGEDKVVYVKYLGSDRGGRRGGTGGAESV
jgi:hypothetical protein